MCAACRHIRRNGVGGTSRIEAGRRHHGREYGCWTGGVGNATAIKRREQGVWLPQAPYAQPSTQSRAVLNYLTTEFIFAQYFTTDTTPSRAEPDLCAARRQPLVAPLHAQLRRCNQMVCRGDMRWFFLTAAVVCTALAGDRVAASHARALPPIRLNTSHAGELRWFNFGDWGACTTCKTTRLQQLLVARQMDEKAKTWLPDLLITNGCAHAASRAAQAERTPAHRWRCANAQRCCVNRDNFYESGVTSVTDDQWLMSWRQPYNHSSLQLPWYACLGNHDYIDNPQAQVREAIRWTLCGFASGCGVEPCLRLWCRLTPWWWPGGVLDVRPRGRLVAHAGTVLLANVSFRQPKRSVCGKKRAVLPHPLVWTGHVVVGHPSPPPTQFVDTVMLSPNTTLRVSEQEVARGEVTPAQHAKLEARLRVDEVPFNATAQLDWIKVTLASSTADWLFVVGHYPVYSGGSHGDTPELQAVRSARLRCVGLL